MAKSGRDAAAVAVAVIGRLEGRSAELTRSIHELLISEIPELRGDAQLVQLLRGAVAGHLDTFFSTVRLGIRTEDVDLPLAALEHIKRRAQRGLPVTALVRSHRLGHRVVLRAALEDIRGANLDFDLAMDVYENVSAMSFDYIDRISQRVISVYQDEYETWVASQSSLRTSYVRELLTATDVDVDAMTTAIRYPLNRIHLGLVVWCAKSDREGGPASMERFVRKVAESIGAREGCLFVPTDHLTGWGWIPLPSSAAPGAVARVRAVCETTDAPFIAVGNPLPGVDGFRRSHRQAKGAYAVAIASGTSPRRLTAADDPGLGLAALLGENVAAAAAWVGEVLGPLASMTDNDERLRETLRVFLRTGASYTAAAEELYLHYNSVRYRVQGAIKRRGRPIIDDRCDVEVALSLCYWFGTAVLS